MEHIDDAKLREIIKEKFESIHRDGLLQGSIAIARVIYDKATNIYKNPEERLEDIIRFCAVSLNERNGKRGCGSE